MPRTDVSVGSNGASQAILDARCLADMLARSEHPRQALAAYERQRLPMTAISRPPTAGGPEGVIDAAEQLAPQATDVDTILSRGARATRGWRQASRAARGGAAVEFEEGRRSYPHIVIARSEATKQSIVPHTWRDALLRFARNDEEGAT